MVAVRRLNFRKGDIAESLGIVLLQGVSLVAPVPRTEDVGLDLVATLLDQRDDGNVYAENSFYVQLKAASVRSVKFEKERDVAWLLALELPFFVGSVDVSKSSIDLFACHRLTQAKIERLPCNSIELSLDDVREENGPKDGRLLSIGPPVASWTINEMTDGEFLKGKYKVLKPHLATAVRNIELARTGRFEVLNWKANEVPELMRVTLMAGGPGERYSNEIRRFALPYLTACLHDAHSYGEKEIEDAVFRVIELMEQAGVDLDEVGKRMLEQYGRQRRQPD